MNKINLSLIIIISFFLLSCQSIKDGLTGKKSENSDEFLVQKKNPLVLPPKYGELPKPKDGNSENMVVEIEDETNIENLFKNNSDSKASPKKSYSDAEQFVLDNIK